MIVPGFASASAPSPVVPVDGSKPTDYWADKIAAAEREAENKVANKQAYELTDEVEIIEDDPTAAMDRQDEKKVVYASEFKVRCPHCGTQTDVKASKAGKQIKCRDCYSPIRVGQPPRVKQKVEIDMEAAPAFAFSPSVVTQSDRRDDPYRKSADEYLTAAAKADEKKDPKPDYDDVPKIRDWAKAVFGIFLQVGVMAHWLVLSVIASTVAFVALAIGNQVLVIGLFAAGGMFAAVVLACGFTIMQSIANEQETVTDWPVTLDPSEWLMPTIFCIVAASLACFPGWLMGYMAFGAGLATVCLTMISLFAIFPFVLLSMLDMQSMVMPFSPDVGRSVTRCEEAWGGFYFTSGVIFFFTFLIFTFASGLAPPATAVVSIFVGVSATFIYFAILGRLAFAIGQSVNAKPKKNTIKQTREAERRQKA